VGGEFDRADGAVGRAFGHLGLDFEGDFDGGAGLKDQVLDD
jgi:hypothetical protein